MAEINAYNEALRSGQYEKPTGLLGKYDNVRRFWEDEQVGLYLRPFMKKVMVQCRQNLRVMDIGCGSGDGLEVIAIAAERPAGTCAYYKGIDINEGLLQQAKILFDRCDNLCFERCDYNEFEFEREDSFDLYLANYGTLSHNTDNKTAVLLANIAGHARNGALICIDWLGRYAYEWQSLWTNDHENNQWMDYVISYIYSDDEKTKQQDLTSFPLRIVGRDEVIRMSEEANELCGGKLVLRQLSDRSSFVGRHQDTAQYNRHCKPLRRVINSLFEPNVVTNLDELLIDYHPEDGFDEINNYYQRLVLCWNYLVAYAKSMIENTEPPPEPEETPEVLGRTIHAMDHLAKAASVINIGHPRAFLFEPQLAYCLRELEMSIQPGQGCGHGLVAIFEVVK